LKEQTKFKKALLPEIFLKKAENFFNFVTGFCYDFD
jgi:hypothetical protein